MLVTMSNKELHRLSVIQAVIEKRLRRRDAASQPDFTERQVQRLLNRYRESGAAGLTDASTEDPAAAVSSRLRWDENDLLEALADLQNRSQEIFGKT